MEGTKFCRELSSSEGQPDAGAAEYCARVRTVNGRWIVHGGLDRDADAYLQYLETTDPDRFERSCRNACRMLERRERTEDPKPWFYAGLFSLAKPEEIERFAARHAMTCAAVSTDARLEGESYSPDMIERLRRLREALASLRE